MTTATKTNPSAELAQLEQTRDRTYSALQEAKRTHDGFDEETERLKAEYGQYLHAHPEEHRDVAQNPKPDTRAAALRDEIRERMAENPHNEEVDAAKAD